MPDTRLRRVQREHPLAIAVLGASGDLAMTKILPALFALYCQELLPKRFQVVGYARTEMTDDQYREQVTRHLTCRYAPGQQCDGKMREFLQCCSYESGQYDAPQDLQRLEKQMHRFGGVGENRVFYMSVPPFLFSRVAGAMRKTGLITPEAETGWSRVVLEKPFGKDRVSSDALTREIARVFSEDQTYRIDHYLGKEVIQNLLVLRFANLIFDPIWNRGHIEHVRISWTEDKGLGGRSGYFDEYGIIRDVMQNHLLQILALTAMEQPVSLDEHSVRDEKVKVLRCVPPLSLEDIVVGQYEAGQYGGAHRNGYLEEEGVPARSITPTYAAAVLHVCNRRWDGVPFLIRAGKGLDTQMTEIRIRFRAVPDNIFADSARHLGPNELVIRVQPDASIAFRVVNKAPGLRISLAERDLDLSYALAFEGEIPEAYERLLIDVIEGDKSLFIRADELEAAWDIFTPALHDLETCTIAPQKYAFGASGPESADALAAMYGTTW